MTLEREIEILAYAYFNHTAIDGKLFRVLYFDRESKVLGLFVWEGATRVGQEHSFVSFRSRLRIYLAQRMASVQKKRSNRYGICQY